MEKWTVRQQDEPIIWDKARSGRNCIYTDADENRIIAFYCQTKQLPKCACGKWTLRKAEQKLLKYPDEVGISPSKSTIHRILNKHHLKPHRKKYFLHISDPDFFPKMDHILYLRKNPPKNLFSFDECSGIQVLLRLAQDLFMSKSKDRISLWLEEFEYIRNGTVDLLAFLDVNSGDVSCRCYATHGGEILSAIFRDHVVALPEDELFLVGISDFESEVVEIEKKLENITKKAVENVDTGQKCEKCGIRTPNDPAPPSRCSN